MQTSPNNGDVTKSDKVIGRRARLLRLEHGLSQDALAQKAGVSKNTLRDFERGTGTTRPTTRHRIAEALGTTLEWLETNQGDLAVAKPPSPMLVDLNHEDLVVARSYHHSPTAVRQKILSLLRESEAAREGRPANSNAVAAPSVAELNEILSRLDDDKRAALYGLATSLQADQDQEREDDQRRRSSTPTNRSVKTKRSTKA